MRTRVTARLRSLASSLAARPPRLSARRLGSSRRQLFWPMPCFHCSRRQDLLHASRTRAWLVHLTQMDDKPLVDLVSKFCRHADHVVEPVGHPHLGTRKLAALNHEGTGLLDDRSAATATPSVVAVHRTKPVRLLRPRPTGRELWGECYPASRFYHQASISAGSPETHSHAAIRAGHAELRARAYFAAGKASAYLRS